MLKVSYSREYMDGATSEMNPVAPVQTQADSSLVGLKNLPDDRIQQYQNEIAEKDKPLPFEGVAEQKIPTKEEQDTQIKKTFEEQGETAAISVGEAFLAERIQKKLGLNDEQMKTLMDADAKDGLKKLFEEKVKKELREQGLIPKTDAEMKPEDVEKVQALADQRAEEYKDKSLKELTGEAIEEIFNNIDFETFIWAVLGKDMGSGRYGHRTESAGSEKMVSDPTRFVLENFQKNPQFQVEYLTRGFAVCKDKTVIEELKRLAQDPRDEGAKKKILDHLKDVIARDPQQAKRFVWGLYVALGQPSVGAQISSEVAMNVVKNIAESKLSVTAAIPEAKRAA